jgi:hypothetical protein
VGIAGISTPFAATTKADSGMIGNGSGMLVSSETFFEGALSSEAKAGVEGRASTYDARSMESLGVEMMAGKAELGCSQLDVESLYCKNMY